MNDQDLKIALLQEALAFHLEKPVRRIQGGDGRFVADFSARSLALMRELFRMEPDWLSTTVGEEVVVFSKDGIILQLN